ncbi:dTMP kinase [Fibrobacterota bacterium]
MNNSHKSGFFFSLEGLDNCGKSTQIKLLTDHLEKKGHAVLQVREPGGCVVSEKIREILLNKDHENMALNTELLLYWAARAQLIFELISPALETGRSVIADRFGWSTFAYQGYGRKMNLTDISFLRELICGAIWPHHSFFLDISVNEMKKRTQSQRKRLDRIESQGDDFFSRIRKGYLSLAGEHREVFTVIDGCLPIETIQKKIQDVVEGIIQGKNPIKNGF